MSRKIIEIWRRQAETSSEGFGKGDPAEFLIDTLFHRPELSWKNSLPSWDSVLPRDRDPSAIVIQEGRCLVRIDGGEARKPENVFPLQQRQSLLDELRSAAPHIVGKEAYGEGILLMPGSLIATVPANLPAADYAFYAVLLIFAIQEVPAFSCKIPGRTDSEERLDPMELVDAMITLALLKVEGGSEPSEDIDAAFHAYSLV